MNILHRVRRLEAGMMRAVERAAREWSRSGGHEPLEVAQAIVDAVAARLEPAARGRFVFPFNRIHVSIAAASKDDRARFAAVLESEPTLNDRIVARLRDAGCDTELLQIAVGYVPRPGADWSTSEFHIDFTRGAPVAAATPIAPAPPTAQTPRELTITVVKGTAEESTYVFTPRYATASVASSAPTTSPSLTSETRILPCHAATPTSSSWPGRITIGSATIEVRTVQV